MLIRNRRPRTSLAREHDASNDPVSREALFSAIVSEAAGFYKVITVTASSFLGGSLIFMEKIAARPKLGTLVLLAFGWMFLIASIGLVAWIRRLNLDAGQMALEGQYEQASVIDKKKRCLSIAAPVALMIGMAGVMAFGLVNVWLASSSYEREMQMGSENPKSEVGRRSIPFGSTGPKPQAAGGGQKPSEPKPSSQGGQEGGQGTVTGKKDGE